MPLQDRQKEHSRLALSSNRFHVFIDPQYANEVHRFECLNEVARFPRWTSCDHPIHAQEWRHKNSWAVSGKDRYGPFPRPTDTSAASADAVFRVPELLESILELVATPTYQNQPGEFKSDPRGDVQSLVHASRVCKQFKATFDSSAKLRYLAFLPSPYKLQKALNDYFWNHQLCAFLKGVLLERCAEYPYWRIVPRSEDFDPDCTYLRMSHTGPRKWTPKQLTLTWLGFRPYKFSKEVHAMYGEKCFESGREKRIETTYDLRRFSTVRFADAGVKVKAEVIDGVALAPGGGRQLVTGLVKSCATLGEILGWLALLMEDLHMGSDVVTDVNHE